MVVAVLIDVARWLLTGVAFLLALGLVVGVVVALAWWALHSVAGTVVFFLVVATTVGWALRNGDY